MALSIHTNYASLVTQSQLGKTNTMLSSAMERLGTGLRINSAADDAAGLQIAVRLQSQSNGQKVAMRNAQDAISMLQTGEGAFDEMTNIAHRMKDLATQAASESNGDSELQSLNEEYQELKAELVSIFENTEYGSGTKLFNGTTATIAATALADADGATNTIAWDAASNTGTFSKDAAVDFQIGASTSETLSVSMSDSLMNVRAGIEALGSLFDSTLPGAAVNNISVQGADFLTTEIAAASDQSELAKLEMGDVDFLLDAIGSVRGEFGAKINRLDHTINNLSNMRENLELSKGRIMDADFAEESSKMTANQTLLQSGISVLGNANQMSSLVSSLLR